MADFQTGVRARLLANGTVAGAVGARIDWGHRPQGSAYPAIVLQTISDPRPAHLKDYEATRSTLVQLDVYATTYAAALSIAKAVIAALKVPATISGKVFGPAFVDGQRDTVETSGTTNIHRQSVDLNIWHVGD
jgi:Protein of unknown function (DUF3168)